MKYIDYILDRITMYRLVLGLLIIYLLCALILSIFRLLPFEPLIFLFNVCFIIAACWISNKFFSTIFKVPTNLESVYITALILALIISPVGNIKYLLFVAGACILAMASKYFLSIKRKHIFNPAAISMVATIYLFNQGASWWVGTPIMTLIVFIGGFFITRKLRQQYVFWIFIFTSVLLNLIFGHDLKLLILYSPLVFFGSVMLTEPATMPPARISRVIYAVVVGILSVNQAPEMALIVGNIYSYLVSPKAKFMLTLKSKTMMVDSIDEFVFSKPKGFSYKAGQYLEWTLPQSSPDSRGTRRYFTLASSPTESEIRLGVKFYDQGSSFKKALGKLKPKDKILAGQLAGEFTLPKNPTQKLVFIAGGIGITPFRSMIKYLVDTNQKADIVLLYSNKLENEIVYQDLFTQATKLGIRTIYILTDTQSVSKNWQGKIGRIDANLIRSEIPDYKNCVFYLSGPQAMVDSYKQMLQNAGVTKIKTDFFPGLV